MSVTVSEAWLTTATVPVRLPGPMAAANGLNVAPASKAANAGKNVKGDFNVLPRYTPTISDFILYRTKRTSSCSRWPIPFFIPRDILGQLR
jgi:hypothetical protein